MEGEATDTVELLGVTDTPHTGYQVGPGNGVSPVAPPVNLSQDGVSHMVIIAACMAALGGILFGYDIGIISGALLQLEDKFNLDCHQSEIVVGSMLFGAILASLTGGFLVDHFGRRLTIIINSGIFIIGAIILACSDSLPVLITGRVIVGFGVSLSAIAECVYISEIAPTRRRGSLVSLNELGITVGFLIAYLVNYGFILVEDGWRYMFGLSAIPAFLQGLGMLTLPTSPRFLMIKNKEAEARSVLKQLRKTDNVESELTGIRESLLTEKSHSFLDLFRSKDNMRSRLLIGGGLIFLQQFTGQPNVLFYAPTIFQSVGFHSNTAATLATIGLGVVKVIFTVISLLCVDKAGRRTFLIVGGSIMAISILVLALCTNSARADPRNNPCYKGPIYAVCDAYPNATGCSRLVQNGTIGYTVLNQTGVNGNMTALLYGQNGTQGEIYDAMTPAARYISLISLMVFVIGFALGFGPVSWLILSEIFPSSIKGRAVSLTTIMNWGTNLLVTTTFLNVIESIGISATFFIYSFISIIAVIFVFAFVPETKNRSLEQISLDLKENSTIKKMKLYWKRLCHKKMKAYTHHTISYQQVDSTETEET